MPRLARVSGDSACGGLPEALYPSAYLQPCRFIPVCPPFANLSVKRLVLHGAVCADME
jgi:hypothetical protein